MSVLNEAGFIIRCVVQAHENETDIDVVLNDINGTLKRLMPDHRFNASYKDGVYHLDYFPQQEIDFILTTNNLTWNAI